MVEVALAYARAGQPVFPVHAAGIGGCLCGRKCDRPGKHPLYLPGDLEQGLTDARRDRATICRWFVRAPEPNIAMRTDDLLVLDVAKLELPTWEENFCDLIPPTLTARTGGGGLHLLLALPAGRRVKNSVGRLSPGIDVRSGPGGYIVAPPSAHKSGGRYRWLTPWTDLTEPVIAQAPDWLLDRLDSLDNARPEKRPRPSRPLTTGGPRIYIDGRPIYQGTRNVELHRRASGMRGRGLEEDELLEAMLQVNDRVCKPPLDEWEVRKIVNSVARYLPGDRQ